MSNKKKIIILSGIAEESLIEKSEEIYKINKLTSYKTSILEKINKSTNIEDNISEYLIEQETLIEMELFDLTTLNIRRLQQDKNIIISKIIFVIENPKVLKELIAKKLNIRWSSSQAEKYQEVKINEAINRAKKYDIDCELYNNQYIPGIKVKQI